MSRTSILNDLNSFINSLPITLNGYTFNKVIGSGGFSAIFLVHSPKYMKDFVCKVMPKKRLDEGKSDYDFLLHLCNPVIVSIYEKFEDSNYVYLIMEYCPNGNLETMAKAGTLVNNQDLLKQYMRLLLEGLNYCHLHGVAHRDIKPANIIINRYMRPKYIDFGISRKVELGAMVAERSGSMPFLAPELIFNENNDPFKADIWSLGVTFYYCAVGELPWPKGSEKVMKECISQGMYNIPKTVDPDIARIIHSMMNVNPKKRPSAQTLLQLELFKYQPIENSPSFRIASKPQAKSITPKVGIPMSFSNHLIFPNRNSIHALKAMTNAKPTFGGYIPASKSENYIE